MSGLGVYLVLFWYSHWGVAIETLPKEYNMESCLAIAEVLEKDQTLSRDGFGPEKTLKAKCILASGRGDDPIADWEKEYLK
jgi:hypothetical protein